MNSMELKAWRKSNGYSQNQLAGDLGVAIMTISRWERGVREIPPFLRLALETLQVKSMSIKKSKIKRR